MATADERRAAETEALFREVNERIVDMARQLEGDQADVVCECADERCAHRVTAPLADYDRTRSNGARFIVEPGHEDERFEKVVARRRGYRIVEKLADVRTLVRRLDPRGSSA